MFKFRMPSVNKLRDAWVEVNLDCIEHNIREIKKLIKPDVKILAVVKADAYGHGSVMLSPTLLACGVDMLGVSSIDEGLELRTGGIKAEILTLGAVPIWSFEEALKNNITVSIFNEAHLKSAKLLYEKTKKKLKVHVKVNTNMNRIGIKYDNAINFIKTVQSAPYIDLKGIFTHFSCAENPQKTKIHFERFQNVLKDINTENLLVHCANSASLISYPQMHLDMVRPGIILYGLLPDLSPNIKEIPKLKQAIALKGRITSISDVQKGEGVSYSHTFIAKKPSKIATIPIGYADGIARNLSNRMFGLLNGKMVKQVGNISMDQIMFDITNVEACVGDVITLLGQDGEDFFSIDEWAKILNTINFELVCRLKVRLPRIYTR